MSTMTLERPQRRRDAVRAHPALRRPPVVERSVAVALAIGVFGQFYAALLLASSWSVYPAPFAQLGLWLLLSAATAALVVVAARRGGELPGSAAVPLVAVLVLMDVAVPALVGDNDPIGPAAWNWSAVAMTILLLAIYLPAAVALSLAALHGLAVVAWAVSDPADGDPVRLAIAVGGAVLPALAGAQFLGFYLGVLARRDEAARAERETRGRQAADEAVARDWRQRISRVRAEALPLVRDVAEGGPLPLDELTAARARRVSGRLRRELVGGREVDWLLRAQVAAPESRDGEDGADGDAVDVEVVTGLGASQLMTDTTRVALGALVSLLRRHAGWTRMTLTVAGAPDRSLMLALVAHGSAAGPAAADEAVLVALRSLGGSIALDDPDTLVIQARLEDLT